MDKSIAIIKALLSLLSAENTRFDGLTRQGATNVAAITQMAENYLAEYEAEKGEEDDGDDSDDTV